ncbi:MAG: alpha/beta hydrolase [Pseudomonadota bacterium]
MTRRGFLAGSAALTTLTGCVSGETQAKTAEEKYPPLGQFITVDGIRMHYVEEGSGPPLVLIHGANGNVRDWTFSMMGRLSESFRVIAIDRPGHGYSRRAIENGADPMVQADLMAKAARRLGADRAIIAGHSWGGAVATAWAVAHPEQVAGASILAGATYPWGGDGGTLYALGAGPLGGLMGAAARSYVSGDRIGKLVDDVFAPDAMPAGYADYIGVELALRPHTFRWNAEDIDQLNDNLTRLAPRYGELAMPLEVVHGDADRTVFDDVHSIPLARDAQNASLTIFPGVGHMPHHARETEVIAGLFRLRDAAFG